MLSRAVLATAMLGSAAAFSPSMSMDMGRREVVQTGAAAAAVAPFLKAKPAGAYYPKDSLAPVITTFDHQFCDRAPKEYVGPASGDEDDNRCVKVALSKITVSETEAAAALQEFISYRAKGIDGDFRGVVRSDAVGSAPAASEDKGGLFSKKADKKADAKSNDKKKGGLFGFGG
ncbi:phycoerythrin alpha subunit 8 [Guillardia theta CCMP2712]|uniref:Phycoerythrin alpha subunit 8 n=1 Tax=Guillardia theta (strain CCMP2712) TaxID=905079 RepID=L1JI35_GUITC|nr:phycoerythrin alpha subunit 8 [Guillardia theta CCMP2712]EKX47755.1 phycoerythrin alpha subunit 8 [Guillardia theta CCMP2712]|mmetsp:Transcript_6812/g.23941  ORF Transcript_6812/g.23941 Transcript_6812/m.23941 type:complete len:174 (-) Transcript_6812:469-990(-)|eukprot:XP_005834735.1 phycoerythrin alpha subunit 8 [Guillardia theta CCMP2712]